MVPLSTRGAMGGLHHQQPGPRAGGDGGGGAAVIMSEEALRQRRALRGQRRLAREQPGGLTAEQQELIGVLIAAHQRTFDSSFSQFTHYWVSGAPGTRLSPRVPQHGANAPTAAAAARRTPLCSHPTAAEPTAAGHPCHMDTIPAAGLPG